MIIRRYREEDLPQIVTLFYETVHHVNIRDYTPKQVDAWATGAVDTHASITARPFFEKRGYRVEKEHVVVRHGVRLSNYVMHYQRLKR